MFRIVESIGPLACEAIRDGHCAGNSQTSNRDAMPHRLAYYAAPQQVAAIRIIASVRPSALLFILDLYHLR